MAEVSRYVDQGWRKGVDVIHRQVVHRYLTSGSAKDNRNIAHERALALSEMIQRNGLAIKAMSSLFRYDDPILHTKIGELEVSNPLWLAAGFDKNARMPHLLGEGLGFGAVVGGSFTEIAYDGNPHPSIFDLPENDGLINRMGFPGDGSYSILENLRVVPKKRRYGLIGNVAASKPSFERGTHIEDYGVIYRKVLPFVDGVEVNVSSPNTEGVTGLQEPAVFKDLASCMAWMRDLSETKANVKERPLIYKFSPDLPQKQLEQLLTIAIDNGADAVTLTNTSTDPELRASLKPDIHKDEVGGMSGALLGPKALEVTHNAYSFVGEELPIIRAGGLRGTGESLWEAFTYGGARAGEIYSYFVRPTTSSPNIAYYTLSDLAEAMRAFGMDSMDDFKDLRGKEIAYPLKK